MKIWQLSFEVDDFDNLSPVDDFTANEIQSFDGRKKANLWTPLKVKKMEPEKKLPLSNAPGFIIPVLDKQAYNLLLPIIDKDVEALPLLCKEGDFYAINVISVLDVIDYSRSMYKMYSDGNRIMAFQKYAFRKDSEVLYHNMFKIIDEPTRKAFVSDAFRDTVLNNNLTGFKFKFIWDSEQE
jgi:hypothetical protein